jgi:uncharacterized protein (DUF305 family)
MTALDDRLDVSSPAGQRDSTRTALLAVCAVALLVIVAGLGYVVGHRSSGVASAAVAETSVDAGFARDMSIHHEQAVSMANTLYADSTDGEVKILAFDISSSQEFQIGQMDGWLDGWGLSRQTNVAMMAWMDHSAMSSMPATEAGALMPGMATPDEMTKLQSMTPGPAQDIFFLQLMLRHHQGGVAMAQYAADHASESYVRLLASKMVNVQTGEIVQMEKDLRARGGVPLAS